MSFIPDTRPVQIIWTGPNQWTQNEILGNATGAFPSFINHLRRPLLVDDPRGNRFVISHPGGFTPTQAAHYFTLPAANRGWYRQAIKIARAEGRTFTLGITVDARINTPFTSAEPHHRVIYTNQTHINEYWGGSACPWCQLIPGGLYEWWHEGVNSVDPAPVGGIGTVNGIGWSEYFRAKGIHGGSEGIPLVTGLVDQASLALHPAWCTSFFLESNLVGQSVTPAPEAHVFLHAATNTYNVAQLQAIDARGFIIGPDPSHDATYQSAFPM